jgi:hypothetical protein
MFTLLDGPQCVLLLYACTSKIVANHALGLYQQWSSFGAACRRMVTALILASTRHARSGALAGDAPMMRALSDECMPSVHECAALGASASVAPPVSTASSDAAQRAWSAECAHALGAVCAALTAYLSSEIDRDPSWIDAYGEVHIDEADGSGVEGSRASSRMRTASSLDGYATLHDLINAR